ncbi:MAG TPA: prepilin-type N-terminal cleavage/methylation domain-containing protein [Sumerlaeia bacterium]|nr:prepilin-type N-terminal cleavage/methylation domain-containing protein [Sumerlaeia bacterium]
MEKRKAFTLIELLIVVAIIAILAAIAVPNFLEAQVRSKVARAKADLRSINTALEAYNMDYNNYPPDRYVHTIHYCTMLSTPVAYISSVSMNDAFNPGWDPQEGGGRNWPDQAGSYLYVNYGPYYGPLRNWGQDYHSNWMRRGCVISSFGPDRELSYLEHYPYYINHPAEDPTHAYNVHPVDMIYDSTNGTRSWGDFGRAIGDLQCEVILGG